MKLRQTQEPAVRPAGHVRRPTARNESGNEAYNSVRCLTRLNDTGWQILNFEQSVTIMRRQVTTLGQVAIPSARFCVFRSVALHPVSR